MFIFQSAKPNYFACLADISSSLPIAGLPQPVARWRRAVRLAVR